MKSFLIVAAILLPFALAAPVDSEEMVLTPSGLQPASGAHRVPAGGSISISGNEIHLLDAAKNVVHVAPKNDTKVTIPQESGWIAYASWYNSGYEPISDFYTYWHVPPEPVTDNGQTIFLFNSIEPAGYDAILQPVLQYGPSAAGGGSYWSVANWYVSAGRTYYTSLVNVTVGQELAGVIHLTSNDGHNYNYVSGFNGIGNELTLENSTELVWATETLESYGVTAGTDYPQGSTLFYNIDVYTESDVAPVTWSTTDDYDDGIYIEVIHDGGSAAVIKIEYETYY